MFYKAHEGILQIIIVIITLYVAILRPIYHFTRAQKKRNQVNRFISFHKLIDKLVDGSAMQDRQIIIIYELRNFPEYYHVTKRVLQGLRNTWKEKEMLVHEIDITIEYIEASRFERRFCFKN